MSAFISFINNSVKKPSYIVQSTTIDEPMAASLLFKLLKYLQKAASRNDNVSQVSIAVKTCMNI